MVWRPPVAAPPPALLQRHHPDGHDDLREAALALRGQNLKAGPAHDVPHDVQVAADAAVQRVQLDALPGHVVLDDDHPAGPQAALAAHQELQQVLVSQVAWRGAGRVRTT